MHSPYFLRICGRDFNVSKIVSIEICEAAKPGYSVCTIEYNDKSITYPIVGSTEANRDRLTAAWRILRTCDYSYMVDTGIKSR